MIGIGFGQALGIIGGLPILQNIKGHTVDGLKIARHLSIGGGANAGGLQSILSGVLSGGIGSMLQSPLGGQLSSLTGAITSAIGSLGQAGGSASSGSSAGSSASSGSGDAPAPGDSATSSGDASSASSYQPVVTALGALGTSATNLSALADNLVGFGADTALPGQLDVVGHMGALQALGPAAPAAVAMGTVLQPVQSGDLLAQAQASVAAIVAQLLAGTIAVSDAVIALEALQAVLDAVAAASIGAIATVQGAQLALCAAQSSIALLVAGGPEIIAALDVAIRPDVRPAVDAIVAAHQAELSISAASQAAAAAASASIAAAQAANDAQRADGVLAWLKAALGL